MHLVALMSKVDRGIPGLAAVIIDPGFTGVNV